ncbi:FAD binding domain-containing protein [Maribacter sp. HTCC2170]|uniref:FAD binding domain-containing protein n=1 Tax=Maribacter sp. (strain HTCC2170 / KCCM 42371) TaxID=313603 RepID=UPI00006BD341|nr:FAD binding domain-containing protein [Maribacter sp. HTCC2170]EAR02510.1 putative oxidoreductase, molybdopterin binding subunit [Maribacter sp. HTCC2170]
MNKFSWHEAKSVEDALQQVNSTVSEALYKSTDKPVIFKSGGIDVFDWIKEGLLKPEKIINIRNIPGLDKITYDKKKGLSIGSNVSLAEIGSNTEIKSHYLALHEAVHHAATPQLRNMSTLGGNLAQRNRCWYFRSTDHDCFRKGGYLCFAQHSETGENENHAIIDNGSCVSIHASSIATALMAFNASVVIVNDEGEKKEVPMDDFFVTTGKDVSKETILQSKEIITEIIVPAPRKNTKSSYIKQVARESHDWSLGDVAVVMEVSGNTCRSASIVLGAAAPTPYRSILAQEAIENKAINNENAQSAAKAAMSIARPLSKNGYKVPMFKSIIKQAILENS